MTIDQYHNQRENVFLRPDERNLVDAGREAMNRIQKTFTNWVSIGEAIKILRLAADRDGRRQTFNRLMAMNGFAMDGPEKIIDKSIATKLIKIVEHKAEVYAWHEKLTPKQQREWGAPTTIFKHCPIFQKKAGDGEDKPAKKLTQAEKDRQALALALEENHRLKAEAENGDGDRFSPTDDPNDVARLMVDIFSRRKATMIWTAMGKLLDERDRQLANTATTDSDVEDDAEPEDKPASNADIKAVAKRLSQGWLSAKEIAERIGKNVRETKKIIERIEGNPAEVGFTLEARTRKGVTQYACTTISKKQAKALALAKPAEVKADAKPG